MNGGRNAEHKKWENVLGEIHSMILRDQESVGITNQFHRADTSQKIVIFSSSEQPETEK